MRSVVVVVLIGLVMLTGCESRGTLRDTKGAVQKEAIYVKVSELQHHRSMADTAQERWKVAVEPFKDTRSEKEPVGHRVSVSGSKTPIYAVDEDVSHMMTLLVIDALKRQKGWDVWLDRPGIVAPDGGPDVRIGGEILECEVTAQSRLIGTNITALVRMVVRARNANGTMADMLIEQRSEDWEFWFDAEDAEDQFNQALHAGLAQLVARAATSNRLLRFTSDQDAVHTASSAQPISTPNKESTP